MQQVTPCGFNDVLYHKNLLSVQIKMVIPPHMGGFIISMPSQMYFAAIYWFIYIFYPLTILYAIFLLPSFTLIFPSLLAI